MKKMLGNQKGFSLVELLIVIAIMGVLAALAFSMFAGILGNTRRRADDRTADQIAKVLTAYIVESGDNELLNLSAAATATHNVAFEIANSTSGAVGGLTVTVAAGDPASQNLVTALQHVIVLTHKVTNKAVKYGPYLAPREGQTPAWANYAPTWNGYQAGYAVEVYSSLQKADVQPVPKNNPGTFANGDALATGIYIRN